MYHYTAFPATLNTLNKKDEVGGISASTALSHECAENCHLCSRGERNGAQMRTKLSIGRTMMEALELQRLAKGMSPDEVTLNSEEIKPVAIELRLFEYNICRNPADKILQGEFSG